MTAHRLRRLGPAIVYLFLLLGCRRQPAPAPGTANALRLDVAGDGLVRVTLADLQAAGLAVSQLDDEALHLSSAGESVPFLIQEDSLIFYGQAPASRYLRWRPYILAAGSAGQLMVEWTPPASPGSAPLAAVPQTIQRQENRLYNAQATDQPDEDRWFWQEIGQQQQVELTLNLPVLAEGPATLQLQLWGVTENAQVENDHDFDLVINGRSAGTVRWDGKTAFASRTAVPAGVLRVGNNVVLLDNSVPGASMLDIAQLNWLRLDFAAPPVAVDDRLEIRQANGRVALTGFSGAPLLFSVAEPQAPRLVAAAPCDSGQACLTVTPEMHVVAVGPAGFERPAQMAPLRDSAWRSADQQADLLIVTTDALAPALAPLVVAREDQGLQVALVTVAEIYDAFGHGAASPQSVQTFVRYTQETWRPPAPRYLLLVGDATTDYRDYLGQAPANIVPPLLVPVSFGGETVSDARLADVDGDLQPELAVGRWPVDSVGDVASLVERTLAYEAGTAADRVLFAADGTESQFADMAQRLSTGSQMAPDRVSLLRGPTFQEVVSAWNEGAWLTTYIGHGSVRRWGKEDVLNIEAAGRLRTTSPSIVLQLTCLSGLFAHPDQASLTEEMMRQPRGPVMHVAATSLTLSTHQEVFAAAFLQQLQDPAVLRIGDAFQAAKLSLDVSQNEGLREVSDTFSLFGDPSALIARPGA